MLELNSIDIVIWAPLHRIHSVQLFTDVPLNSLFKRSGTGAMIFIFLKKNYRFQMMAYISSPWRTFCLFKFYWSIFLHILLFFDVSNYSKFFAFHVHFLMICSTRIKPITLHGVMWCYSVASPSLFHIHSQWIAGTRRFLELFHLFYLISRFHCTRGQLNVNICICVTSAVFLLFFSALTQKPSNRFQHLSGHNSFVFMKCRRFIPQKWLK